MPWLRTFWTKFKSTILSIFMTVMILFLCWIIVGHIYTNFIKTQETETVLEQEL